MHLMSVSLDFLYYFFSKKAARHFCTCEFAIETDIALCYHHIFSYLGSLLTEDARCDKAIKKRIAMANAALMRRGELL